MFRLAVYPGEEGLGLDAPAAASLRLSGVARPAAPAPALASANPGQPDLFHVETVLVSAGWGPVPEASAGWAAQAGGRPAGWNLNHDFFDALETWAARGTPEDKKVDFEHDEGDVIGHITANRVVGPDGPIPPSADAASLPARFDVVTGAVLYSQWADEKRQARMDGIIAALAAGTMHVSMEALFRDFDYALLAADGSHRVVARNKSTAFLTRHLPAYGGTGSYGAEKLARVLRGVVFSGKGIVAVPANPASVVVSTGEKAAASVVYLPAEAEPTETTKMTEAELKALKDSLLAAEAALAAEKALSAELPGAKASLAAEQAAHADARKALEASLADAASLRLEVRASAAREGLGMDAAASASYAKATARMSDEEFSAAVAAMKTVKPTTNNPADGNTAFPAPAVSVPVGSTGLAAPPKSTPAPSAPRAAAALPESDPNAANAAAGERALAAAITPAAVTAAAPAESAVLTTLRLAIAKRFGYTPESAEAA